jgi:hypothetical protein
MPAPLRLDQLTDEDRAFLELVAGEHRRLETMKLLFSAPRHRAALIAMQRVVATITAAAIKPD